MTPPHRLLCATSLCCFVLVLWMTTGANAQVIRTGGGNTTQNAEDSSTDPMQQDDVLQVAPFQLGAGYPSPFNPSTTLHFELFTPASIQLDVFNMHGQRVRTLVSGWQEAGVYDVRWDARDAQGSQLSSGVYLVRLVGRTAVQTTMVILQK